MKLYTEQEVRKLLNEILMLSSSVEDAINSLSPIELPSDEEIDKYVKSTGYYGHCTHEYHEGIEEGAKYVINKIQGGNNEQ